MRNRFGLALLSVQDGSLPLSQIAENLMLAAQEAESEGTDMLSDPAVTLLIEQVKFFSPRRFDRTALLRDCELNDETEYPTFKERH